MRALVGARKGDVAERLALLEEREDLLLCGAWEEGLDTVLPLRLIAGERDLADELVGGVTVPDP